MNTKRLVGAMASVISLVSAACGAPDTDASLGVARAEVRLTSSDVRCLVVKGVGSTTVTQQTDVEGQATSTVTVTGLPVGSVTFTASAYSVKCASTGSNSATYVSDPVTQTVVAGVPLSLVFTMRPAATTGSGQVAFEFPQVKARTAEFPIWSGANGYDITTGPDGNLWFAELQHGVGVMTPDGTMIADYPYASADPSAIVAGADGNLWMADPALGALVRVTTSGTMSFFYLQGNGVAEPTDYSLALGPDGLIWFTELGTNKVGKITPLGVITEYAIPTANSGPYGITAGPDGNVWFTETYTNKIGRVTPTGTMTEYTIPTSTSVPYAITAGPDGNLWFTERNKNKVGKISTSGTITEYALPTPNSQPGPITRGPDGNLWFTVGIGGIDKITTAGAVTEFGAPDRNGQPWGIALGPDGNLWVAAFSSNKIVRLTP
jgi:streptogramin lyase